MEKEVAKPQLTRAGHGIHPRMSDDREPHDDGDVHLDDHQSAVKLKSATDTDHFIFLDPKLSAYTFASKLKKSTPFLVAPIATLLAVAVIFSHTVAAFQTVEIEHSHINGNHHHSHGDFHDSHHTDSHHHTPPTPLEGHDESDDTSIPGSDTHKHIVTTGIDGPVAPADFPAIIRIHTMGTTPYIEQNYSCPDGPLFEVIKPPQLG